jgi:polyribonucleotide nucleotidyltransferase
VVKRGDALRVKVLESDPQGRLRLSHKAVLIEEGKLEPTVASDDSGRGGRPDRGGRDGGDRDRRGGRGGDRGGRR